MLTAARLSPNDNDSALVVMLGLLGLRIFEATGADITDLREEHRDRVLRVVGKGTRVALVPLPPPAATRRLHHLAETPGVHLTRMHPHMLRHTFVTTMLDAGADLRDVQTAARRADPRTRMRDDRARQNLDRHPILAAYVASGTWRNRLLCRSEFASSLVLPVPTVETWTCCEQCRS